MIGFHSLVRTLKLTALAILITLAMQMPVLAQDDKSSGGASYILPYAVVLLGIGLGFAAVFNPSRRRDRATAEQYGDKDL